MALSDLIQHDRFQSSAIRDLLVHARKPNVVSLAGGLPSESALPVDRFAKTVQHLLMTRGAEALQYGMTAGEPELQQIIAASCDFATDPSQIVVTAGSQQALDLVIRVVASNDVTQNIAVVEDPGYLGALQAFRGHAYTLAPIPVDENGLQVDLLETQLRDGLRPRLCYVNPAFQNPTGASIRPDRAVKLVALAEQYNFLIIADDPYAELFFGAERPVPLPQSDLVVRLGSTSKTLSPGLRVGWLNAHEELATVAALAKQPADLQTSTLNQLVVAELLSDRDWWASHTDALRSEYRDRRDLLIAAVRRHLPEVGLALPGDLSGSTNSASLSPDGGFFLWVSLPRSVFGPVDTTVLLPSAVDAGVAYVPGDAFTVETPRPNSIRLSYSSGDPANFDAAIAHLSRVLRSAKQPSN